MKKAKESEVTMADLAALLQAIRLEIRAAAESGPCAERTSLRDESDELAK